MERKLNVVENTLNDLSEAFSDTTSRKTRRRWAFSRRISKVWLEPRDFTDHAIHNDSQMTGQGGDMSDRITNLESQVGQLRVDMAEVKTKVSYIEANMLTKGRAAIIALVVVVAIFGSGWWVVQQYLAPILAGTVSS